jgi:alkylation response protein AidB-like acyl-CoA dehydrogenase
MGWDGHGDPRGVRGAGFGHLELCVIAEELGRCVAPIPFSSTLYLGAEVLLLAGTGASQAR